MESKEKAENSNDWKVVSISKKKGMNISMLLFSQWNSSHFALPADDEGKKTNRKLQALKNLILWLI